MHAVQAGTNAKEEFLLTDGELKVLPRTDKSRGSLGTTHLYALTDVLPLARAKHGDPAGLAAARVAKAAKAGARKEKAKEKGQAKVDALREALAQRGSTLSPTLLKVGRVQEFLRKGGSPAAPERLLAFLDLLSWSERHTSYPAMRKELVTSESRWLGFKIHFRDEGDGGSFNDYYGKASKAASTLHDSEEDDCVRLALQVYAERYGGVSAALGRPEVPPDGTPLRAAVAAAMRQRISTGILYDLPEYEPYSEDDMMDSEEEFSEDDADAAEGEGAEGEESEGEAPAPQAGVASGSGAGSADPAGQGPGMQAPPFFERGHHRYVQVTVTPDAPADLEAWQRWVAGKLGWLARRLTSYGSHLGEASPQAFRPPAGEGQGGGDTNGSGSSCCFFVGVSFCQPPTSLYDASGASVSGGGGGREDEGTVLAGTVEAADRTLAQRAQRWQGPPGGASWRCCRPASCRVGWPRQLRATTPERVLCLSVVVVAAWRSSELQQQRRRRYQQRRQQERRRGMHAESPCSIDRAKLQMLELANLLLACTQTFCL